MSFLLYISILLMCLLQACTVAEDSAPTANSEPEPVPLPAPASTRSLEGDPDRMHQVADDRTAGRIKPRVYRYLDSATGTEYQMNSGWRVLPRQAAPTGSGVLAKTTGSLIQTWTDWSGQVETRIYECVTPTAAQHQSLGCQVESGFMLTGGGAYADYGNGPGALLWESRPLDASLVTWVASSKDHLRTNPHVLRVYSIGMRLKDSTGAYIPVTTLRKYFTYRTGTSSPAVHYPEVTYRGFPPGLPLSGGARTNWIRQGSLLTALYPEYLGSYSLVRAAARDHGVAELTTLSIYEILANELEPQGVKIPAFGFLEFGMPRSEGNSVGKGVATVYRDVTPGSALISMGGLARFPFNGAGRYLFGIKPTGTFQGQVGIYSKDHVYPCSGNNWVELVEARKWGI